MAELPQELIDKIIDEVAQCDATHTLRVCCLVQKRWMERSRMHLFKDTSLYAMDHFRDWIKFIPLSPDGPYHHVRSLTYRQGAAVLGPKQLLDLYPGHFTSFKTLESLQIFNLSLRRFTSTSMEKAFDPIGRFVRRLVVKDVVLTLNSLLMFLVHFPRLETLYLGDTLNMAPEKKKQPQKLPNLTGELVLISMGSVHRQFVLQLSKLPLRYSELDVEFRWNSEILNAIAHLILTCSPTLEKLTLRYARALFIDGMSDTPNSDQGFTHACWTGLLTDSEEVFPLDLKSCPLLRKVSFQVPKREAEEHLVRLLGTIRSHKLETIEFIGPANSVQPSTWAMVDDELCALVDRLEEDGWKGKLTVMIHHSELRRDGPEEDQLLAQFRSKGEVVESVDNRLEALWESYWY
jgi:hypothetical protein